MQINDLVIDRLALEVQAENAHEPNELLLKITAELKGSVLPEIENRLNELDFKGDLKIDRLDLNLSDLSPSNWQKAFVSQFVEKVVTVSESESLTQGVHLNKAEQSLIAKIQESLSISNSPSIGENWAIIEQEWLILDHNDRLFHDLGHFLMKSDKYLTKFLSRSSASLLKKLLHHYIYEEWSLFLTEIPQLSEKNDQFRTELIKKVLESRKYGRNNFEVCFLKMAKQNMPKTTHFITEILQKGTKNTIKHTKNLKILMKPNSHENFKTLSHLIRQHSDIELVAFLEFIRSDLAVMALMDPLLEQHYEGITETKSLTNWSENFVESITDKFIIQNLLIELEDLKPLNGNIKKPEFFAQELDDLIKNLERKFDSIKDSKLSNKENLAKYMQIDNAGIVLLNPFLPVLFKNLDLLNAKNEWHSQNHQIVAIYVLHQLATGLFSATEDQLLLYKIIIGFPKEELVKPFEEAFIAIKHNKAAILNENGALKEVASLNEMWPALAAEMDNLLTAIQENWRPMRNCTWEGLRNDFLFRQGELKLMNNLQYILTVEPHTFDVLLSQMQWGMNRIKYSWMDEVLNVEWGE